MNELIRLKEKIKVYDSSQPLTVGMLVLLIEEIESDIEAEEEKLQDGLSNLGSDTY